MQEGRKKKKKEREEAKNAVELTNAKKIK